MLAAQSALETKQTALETEYAALQANQTALEQEYAESQTAQTVLREDYAELLGNEAEVRENYAGLQDDFSRLEDRYSALRTDKAAIEAVSSNLAATLDIEAEVRRLQASSDIQYAAAFDAVQRFRDSADEPLGSITLAETAVRQLDSYIEGARALESKQQDLTGLVAVEHAAIYADSARLAQGKINQALYLRELVTGMSLNATVEQEYENALLEYRITGVAFTDDQKNAWQSDLDAALDQYQRAIDLLYGLLVLDPGLSIDFDGNVAEIEELISGTLLAKRDIEASLPPPPPTAGPDDHGDSKFEATFVLVPSLTPGVINNGTDQDFFTFEAQAGIRYVIETVLGTLDDSTLTLIDSRGSEIDYNDDFSGLESRLDYTAASSETPYMAVAGFDDTDTGSYELRVAIIDLSALGPDDHGDSITESTSVRIPSSTAGVIDYARDKRYFTFEAQAGGRYVIETVLGTLDDSTLTLIDSSGTRLEYNDDYSGLESRIDYTAALSSTLFVLVESYDAAETGSYELDITAALPAVPTAAPAVPAPTAAPAAATPTPIVVPTPAPTPSP